MLSSLPYLHRSAPCLHIPTSFNVLKCFNEEYITQGREGKGSIFVFANGNGGSDDDCAADGYASSMYTISVGSIGVDGLPSWYDEQCSAKMVVAYVTDPNQYPTVVRKIL